MLGYFDDPEATAAVFDEDGFFRTGDYGRIEEVDGDKWIYITGRLKNLIIFSNGKNVYPEEIENKLNNLPYVAESLVIDNKGELEALIYPDYDALAHEKVDRDDVEKIMNQNIDTLNQELPGYSKVKKMKLMSEEFEKTPKRSIKRFLYQP